MKLKHVSIFILLALIAVFTMGVYECSGPMTYVDRKGVSHEIEDPQAECVIYRILGTNTGYYKTSLMTFNYAALKGGWYTPEEADRELTVIEQAVDNAAATVGSVINTMIIVSGKASKVGAPEMIMITENLAMYKNDMTPIDDCTWFKLKGFIGSQRNLIYAFR